MKISPNYVGGFVTARKEMKNCFCSLCCWKRLLATCWTLFVSSTHSSGSSSFLSMRNYEIIIRDNFSITSRVCAAQMRDEKFIIFCFIFSLPQQYGYWKYFDEHFRGRLQIWQVRASSRSAPMRVEWLCRWYNEKFNEAVWSDWWVGDEMEWYQTLAFFSLHPSQLGHMSHPRTSHMLYVCSNQ